MKFQIYFLLLLLMASCQKDEVQTAASEPDAATVLSGIYKVTAFSILSSTENTDNLPDDSLFIDKISPTVVKATYRIKSSIIDSREKEYLTVEKKGKDYYWFTVADGHARMTYQYDKIKLVLADTYYTLYFTKQ